LLAAVLAAVGCGGSQLVEVSGEVTFDGKPVPAGRIYFTTDTTKGNDGPQGFAEIHDGKFDTRKNGRGAWGGPTVVSIKGFDGNMEGAGNAVGRPLFKEHKVSIDLPRESCTQNFTVPAAAAKDLPKTPPSGRGL
jgi:hypothetical protein